MRRRLVNFAAAASLLPCVLAAVVWALSYQHRLHMRDIAARRAPAADDPQRPGVPQYDEYVRWDFHSLPGAIALQRTGAYLNSPGHFDFFESEGPGFVWHYGARKDPFTDEREEQPEEWIKAIRERGGWTRGAFGYSAGPSPDWRLGPVGGRSLEWKILLPDWTLVATFGALPFSLAATRCLKKLRHFTAYPSEPTRRAIFTFSSAFSLMLCIMAMWLWAGSRRHYLVMNDLAARSVLAQSNPKEWTTQTRFASFVQWELHSLPGSVLLRRKALHVKPPGSQWISRYIDQGFVAKFGLRTDGSAPDDYDYPGTNAQAIRDFGGWSSAGFGFSGIHPSRTWRIAAEDGRSAEWEILLPDWAMVIAFGALPVVWASRRRKRGRNGANLCSICGYDLRATPERCPECGATPAPHSGHRSGVARRS